MYNFEKLPEEKKSRIIKAAYLAFAENGYEKTSVSDIAAMAQISKASVFYYFGTKQELWNYLYNTGMNVVVKAVYESMDVLDDDFFMRIKKVSEIKYKAAMQHPGMIEFFMKIFKEDNLWLEHIANIKQKEKLEEATKVFWEGVNWNKFKTEYDVKKIINIIMWIGEGYAKTMGTQPNRSVQEMSDEIIDYMEMLKKAFYKEEYL